MPTVIDGRYEIVSKVGQGGMGTVFRARHLTLDTTVALKILPEHLADNPDLVARFQREARVMAQLRQENIVRVFDVAREGNLYYLVEEFVDGENLSGYVKRRGPLPPSEAIAIVIQVARGLAHAHARNVVHRDIKPSNVLVETEPPHRILVADFGIAKVEDFGERTQTGTVLGSIKYSAPEQLGYRIDGQRVPVDARADIYALALVLYELCEGTPFFSDMDPTEVLARVLYDREPLTPTFTRPVPPALEALIRRAVSRDPASRQQSMHELLDELNAVARSLERADEAPTVLVGDQDRTVLVSRLPEPSPVTSAAAAVPGADTGLRTEVWEPTVRVAPAPGPSTSIQRPRETFDDHRDAPPRATSAQRPPVALLGAGAAATAVLALAAWVFLRAPSLPPLGWADLSPAEAARTIQGGESVRFTARVANADRRPDLRLAWLLDGKPQADGASFEFRAPGDGPGTREVTVTATAGGESVEHRWRVDVTAPPPPPPPPTPAVAEKPAAPAPVPLTIAARNPTDESLVLEPGHRVDFGVQPTDTHVGYEWSLDGKVVGRDRTLPLDAAKDAGAPGAHRLEVVVARDSDGAVARATWSLETLPGGPRIAGAEPKGQTATLDPGASLTLRVTPADAGGDGALRGEWTLDGKPTASRPEADALSTKVSAVESESPTGDVAGWRLVPGRHVVQVALVDARGRRSSPQRWVVNARPAAPAPTETAAAAAPGAGPDLTERDAREWIDRLRSAWERKDLALLGSLGIAASDKKIEDVVIGDASIIVDPRGALVAFDYSIHDKGGASDDRHETVRIERSAQGIVVAPGSARQASRR